jgi:uncharacterized surface protein with fasciclin (FAS1) repeats
MKKIFFVLLLLAVGNVYQAQAQDLKSMGKQMAVSTLLSLAQQNPKLSKFVALIQAAGLTNLLTGSATNPVTLLAPTNTALEAMGGELTNLLKPENKNKLVDLVKNHIITGNLTASTMPNLESSLGNILHVSQKDGKTMIENANIVEKDLKAANGTVQIIDKVLMPKL